MNEIIDEQFRPQQQEFEDKEDYSWGTYAHLSYFLANFVPLGNIIGAAIVWNKVKDEGPINSENAREALNYQITHTLGIFAMIIPAMGALFYGIEENVDSMSIVGGAIIGLVMIWAFATFVFVIMGAVKASKGKVYRYPINFSFIKPRFPDHEAELQEHF